MTVISSILQDAYRESNMIPLGKTLSDAQTAEALRLLNSLFQSIYGGEAGEPLEDWPLGEFGRVADTRADIDLSQYQIDRPPLNRRLIAVNETAKTVYLSPRPQDGARHAIADPFGRLASVPVTLDANGRTIEGSPTLLLDVDGTFEEWIYRADLSDWVRITNKLATDEMPFPSDFDNFFIILLSMRLNPRYGRSLDAQSQAIFQVDRRKFVARYLQSYRLEINDDISWPFMSQQSYDQDRSFSSADNFNRGVPWE